MRFYFRYVNPILRTVSTALRVICAVHITNEYFIEITQCMGPSMLPTFNVVGDFVALEHFSPRLRRLEIGDVIVCKSPTNPWRSVCKRIVGMPGDRICIDPTVIHRKFITVPPGHVWIQGDNMSNSTDSRSYGPIPYALIGGKVFARVWPNPCWIKNGLITLEEN